METVDVNFPESPKYFTAVEITRPAFFEPTPSTKESPVNQCKVAKLVLKPKPVRSKAKTSINSSQQQKEVKKAEPNEFVLQAEPLANSFTNGQNKPDDADDQLRKTQDIELERVLKKPKAVALKKTLNVQRQAVPVESPVANKSKMDEGARCEARKFMKKQREKRKMEVKKEIDKSFVIKQRLEELRLHTKDALVRKAKTSPVRPTPPPLGSSYYSLSNHKMKEIKVLKLKPMTPQAAIIPEETVGEIPIESTLTVPKSAVKPPLPKNQASVSPMRLSPNPLQSPTRFDTKRQSSQPSTRPSSSKENKKSDNNHDLRLIVPDVKLSMINTSTKQILNRSDLSAVHNQTYIKPVSNNIPNWLQNSVIQPYPYNFIWAVRKKLEALTSQQQKSENVKNKKQMQFDLETPQIKRNKKSAKARRLQQNLMAEEDYDSETNAKSEDIELPSEANTISEISSIRSDIATEQKSQSIEKQSSMKNDVDEATISESIFHTMSDDKFVGKKRESVNSEFDRASFDKKLQALGPENISPNTTMKKNNFLSSTLKTDQVPKIEEAIFKQPKIPSHASSTKTELNDLDNNNKVNEDKEEEFKKMLLAFNKSLSHVVEVNHLLSAALVSKSSSSSPLASIKSSHKSSIESQIQSIDSSKKDSEHDNRYSSSFEKNIESSEKTSNISEMIENMIQADTKQHQSVAVIDESSEHNSSIQTLIAESDKVEGVIEDPPIVYHSEQAQELTSSTTKITITRTDNNLQELTSGSRKNLFETTLNDSKLISMFRLSESEVSFIESVTDQPDGNNLFIKSTSEIKSWERSLIERTRGQIAWLELQKLNFKKHGQLEKVSTIKKQQRAILLRLEKERIKLREENSEKSDKLIDQAVAKLETSMDMTGNDSDVKDCIERILQQREHKIIQRRKKIEHLVGWQRRLDDEEKKLKFLERELLNANKTKSIKSPRKKSSHDLLDASFEMVKSIDHSLKVLDTDVIARDDEKVEIIGSKMNKLWYRLTGLAVEKYIPKRIYQLTKIEIAQFYEDAKEAVLESDLKILLETSLISPVKQDMKRNIDDEDVKLDEEKKTFSRSDTMNSIANIETEEEYPNSYTNEQTATQSENDNELQELMANQMKVFVDQRRVEDEQQQHVNDDYRSLIAPALIAAVNDQTFQVQNVPKDESQSQGSNKIIESVVDVEGNEEESQIINTEPLESNDVSEVFEELSMILDTQSTSHAIQITDMDQDFEDENIQMIENISFPNLEISLSDTLQNEFDNERGHDLSTITECTEYEQGSSGPMSSEIVTHSTTPTTSERLNSEIEQRLLSINDSLELVEEAFKKVPLKTAAASSSVTYSTDRDFVESEQAPSYEKEEGTSKSDLVLSTPTSESGSQIATSTPKILMPDVISGAESLK